MRWRVIVDDAAGGAANMARDEALLETALVAEAGLTLRLYSFRTPTITFGYGETFGTAIHEASCRRAGVEVVRRITGGRALLHQHELTFSVTAPRLARSLKATYRQVMGAFEGGLETLGAQADPPKEAPAASTAAGGSCLAVPTGHEISVAGNKLVAAAMRFRKSGFLLHGSVLLRLDRELHAQLHLLDADGSLPAVGLNDVLGRSVRADEIARAVSRSFETLLGSSPERARPSISERARAGHLEQKYRSESWTKRRRAPDSGLVDNSEAVW